ncbi:enoyl-CoA hydratase [Nisaea acidiphila]|uniref:Enoyl-CoA hydratase domain-containing protein 3, mitochondrial n=1 Tax=Nisaea acidiphila TaxID=1862145 RepID=A0A9J7ARI3_9PROT|nr:enoyl-CoA hydratase [Nisaea acidiphila]UUX49814.1 enoyl-CoA hydratase [Nisaea acidiphila]
MSVAEDLETPLVLRSDADGIACLTLNRPKAYNALSLGLMAALQAELDAIASDRAVKVVILEGTGKGFCAGHDLREMRARTDAAFHEQVFAACSKLMMSITELPQPVIAKVHGIATAAGCQIVATADLAVAADDTRFGTPGVNIGLFCSTPMVAVSRAIPRKQVMEMLLTGEMIDADTALRHGLINRAVPEAELDAAVSEMAGKIASKSPLVLKTGKAAFYRQLEMPLAEAYAYTSKVMVENMQARDAAEGIDAFIEKRSPKWTGE